MRGSSALLTRADPSSRIFCFLVLLRIMCEVKAWKRLTFPFPVSLKRFFALEWVFIFGMTVGLKRARMYAALGIRQGACIECRAVTALRSCDVAPRL